MNLSAAVALHQQGRLAEAERLYRQILTVEPQQPQALHFLGLIAMSAGHVDAGIELFQRSISANPAQPAVLSNLTQALFERATTCLVHNQPQAALDGYDTLLHRAPSHADAWSNRGNALQELGRLADALESYDRALKLQPKSASTHNNRGNAFLALGRLDDALKSYDRAIQLDPQLAHAQHSRGIALRDLGKSQEALECFDRVLQLDPNYAEALNNRGNALRDLERHDAAVASYDRALQALPDSPDVLANRAAALSDLGQHDEAAQGLRRLVQVAPDYDYALGNLLQSQLNHCDWSQYDSLVVQVLSKQHRVIHPFTMLAVSSSGGAQLHAAELHASKARDTPIRYTQKSKIRLAYVSADLRDHAVSYLLAGVFEKHDREQFETIAISLRPPEDSVTGRRVAGAFDRFEDVSRRSDSEVAALMRKLEIDIAVDLMGYTNKARPDIFAHRAAPVQVAYLGYPGTLGAPFMDYILADEFVIPPASQQYYSEKVVYLPDCFQANDDCCVVGPTPTRAALGLPDEALVFCCINNNYKLNPGVFSVWMRLLQQTPNSVLWLLAEHPLAQMNLRREAQARGLDPDRLVFAGRMPYARHLGRLGLADLFLDTLPYNAGATASDALRVGVPVLTCTGEAFASRMAGSLLRSVGLPELLTSTMEEYERKALELARDPQALTELKQQLARNLPQSPLYDTQRFCRHLEAAYRSMLQS